MLSNRMCANQRCLLSHSLSGGVIWLAWVSTVAGPDALQAAAASGAAGQQDPFEQQGHVAAADFAAAMQRVGPSIVRGAAVEVAPVSWDEVGGYADVKRRLQQAVEWPLQHAGQRC